MIEFLLGKLSTGSSLTEAEATVLSDYIYDLENLLDEADGDDYFGTEGWRHRIGVD